MPGTTDGCTHDPSREVTNPRRSKITIAETLTIMCLLINQSILEHINKVASTNDKQIYNEVVKIVLLSARSEFNVETKCCT